jgi:hypothetical protein
MNETAVLWLVDKLDIVWDSSIIDLVETALKIEKEQIINAHVNGQAEFDSGPFEKELMNTAEQYYVNTFKQ